jgi:hypothetical protein
MIINKNDITTFKGVKMDGDLALNRIANIHNPSGVFFERVLDNETYEFLFFAIGAIDDQGEIQDRKVFDAIDSESFFKAVDYFEKLIEERTPEKKNEPPSVGIFVFIKRGKKLPSFVDIGLEETIIIDEEDLEKVFTPPMKKPFGRLDMTIVDKPKYDVIKSKFALSFNQDLTNEYSDKFEVDKDDIYVYKITPYQNQPNDPNNQDGEEQPEEVNDEELSLDKIEGEDPEKMKGEEKEKKKKKEKNKDKSEDGEDGEDGDPSDEKGEDDEKGDPSDEKGEDGDDSEPSDEDGEPSDEKGDPTDEDGDPSDEKGDSTDEDGEPSDEKGDPTDEDGEPSDEKGDPSDEDSDNEERKNREEGDDEDQNTQKGKIDPKVGDLIQYRDTYGVVVMYNSTTRETQIKKLSQEEWVKKAQEKEENRKQGKTSSSGKYNVIGGPVTPEMQNIIDSTLKNK